MKMIKCLSGFHFSAGCKELEYINLSYCAISPEGINVLVGCGHGQIKSLLLSYCTEVTQHSYFIPCCYLDTVQINNDALQSIGTNCPNLLTLNIQGCRVCYRVNLLFMLTCYVYYQNIIHNSCLCYSNCMHDL